MRFNSVCKKGFLYDNEINMKDVIENIDEWELRFLPVTKMSNITVDGINKIDYGLLEYEYNELTERKCAYNNVQFNIFYLLLTYKFLLESIKIMIEYDIIHLGISDNTIVWNNKYNDSTTIYSDTILITNFSKSLFEPSVKRLLDMIEHCIYELLESPYVAIELKLICYVKSEGIRNLNIDNANLFISKYLNTKFKESYLTYIINHYCNVDYVELYDKLFKSYNTWDNYALSILYLDKIAKLDNNHPILVQITNILVKCINVNPEKRPNISAILMEIEDI